MQTGAARASSGLARCAVGVAAAVVLLDALAGAIFIVAFSSGGSDAVSDNWIGLLGAIALIGGLIASLVAFVLAIAAKIRREQWVWLWFPLVVFPVLLTFVLFGEVLWWE
jgi:hypothetical protein